MNAGRSKDSHVIKDYYDQASEYISKALRIDKDDAGDKEQAVQWYKKGIAELERGIAVELTGQEDLYDLTKRLQDSMIWLLTMARDKLSLLEATLASERRSNPLSSSNHVLPQPKPVPKSQPATRGVSTNIRPSNTKVAKQTGKPQNGRPAAVKQPPERYLKCLKNVDSNLANFVRRHVVDNALSVSFGDIVGQTLAKEELTSVIYPAIRPDLLDKVKIVPPCGLLLFGPPGTGKTTLAKAVITEANAAYIYINCSGMIAEYFGDGRKFVNVLFAVARELEPSVIVMDEIDSLMCRRTDGNHTTSRAAKNEFLREFDGLKSGKGERVFVMAATNRPQDLGLAVLRRFTRRVYVTLPDAETRFTLLKNLLKEEGNPLSESELSTLVKLTEGYSGRDLTNLAEEAQHAVLRELEHKQIQSIASSEIRNINMRDFEESMKTVWPTVDPATLNVYTKSNKQYGRLSASAGSRSKPPRWRRWRIPGLSWMSRNTGLEKLLRKLLP